MSYKDFASDLKKNLTGNAIFLYGEENLLMRWAIDSLIKKNVTEEYRELDVQEFSGDYVSMSEVLSHASTYSMFSEKRVILVRNFKALYKKKPENAVSEDGKFYSFTAAEEEKLFEFIGSNQDTSILVFYLDSMFNIENTPFRRKLAKEAQSYEFAKLERRELKGFVNKRITAANKFINNSNMEFLIDASGYYNKTGEYSLYEMEKDLVKVLSDDDNSEVDRKAIEQYILGEEDQFIFGLVDAIMANNKKKAMNITMSILEKNDNTFQIVGLLSKQFEMMYDALELEEAGRTMNEMVKALNVNSYRFKKAYTAAKKFNKNRIEEIITRLYNIDKNIKSGNMKPEMAIELFIVEM